MRRDETARPSVLQRLFAERHIYLRSGPESRYVRVSSGLQLAVTALFLLAIAALSAASYTSVVSHLEAAERSREVARLEGVNKSLLAATEAVRSGEELRSTAEPRLSELTARLEEAEASRARAEQLAEAAGGEAAEMRRELDLMESQLDESRTRLAALEAERDALTTLLDTRADAAGGGDPGQSLEAEIAALATERAALEAEVERLRAASEAAGGELAAAREEVDALEDERDQATAGNDAAVEALEVRVATLRAENERLSAALDEVRAERHDLASQLQMAEGTEPGAGATAGADPVELDRLRAELEAANERIAELEQTGELAAVAPGAGPPAEDDEVARLEEALADAEQRIAELETDLASLSTARRPVIGDDLMASDFDQDDGSASAQIGPAPGYQDAAAAVAALEVELNAADELAEALAEGADAERIADLRRQMVNAGERIRELQQTIESLTRRDIALQQALVTLAPLPPPPAPR